MMTFLSWIRSPGLSISLGRYMVGIRTNGGDLVSGTLRIRGNRRCLHHRYFVDFYVVAGHPYDG